MIEEDGKPLVRLVPEPFSFGGSGSRRNILEDMAEWDRTHGLSPDDDAPDFPDVWLDRRGTAHNPFKDEEGQS